MEKTTATLSATVARKGLAFSLLLFALLSFGLGSMEQGTIPDNRGMGLLEGRAETLGVEVPTVNSAQAREMVLGNTAYMLGWMLGSFVSAVFVSALAWVGCRTTFVIYEGVVSGGLTFRKSFFETSKVGNSLFFFWLVWFFLGQVVSFLTVFSLGSSTVVLAQFSLLGFLFILGMVYWVLGGVLVPVMGHDRVGVYTAWLEWVRLFQSRPGVMLFYFPVSLALGVLLVAFVVVVWVCVVFLVALLAALLVGVPWFFAGGSFSTLPTSLWVWFWIAPVGILLAVLGVGMGLTSVVPVATFYRAWSLAYLQGFFPDRFSFFPSKEAPVLLVSPQEQEGAG